MPLENVKRKILEDAEEAAAKIKDEGTSEARRILSEAEAKAKQIEHQAQEEANTEAKRIAKEHESAMEIETKTILAEARGLQLDRATEEVISRVKKILEEKYLKKMLEKGIEKFSEVHSGDPVLVTSKKNQDVAMSLKKPLDIKYNEVEGFVIKAKDGSVAINVSAEALVRDNIDDIRRIVSKNIFGSGESPADEGITEEEML